VVFLVRAQASIETITIFSVAVVCVLLSVGIVWDQVFIYQSSQQRAIAFDAVNILALEADDVYFLGPGSVRTLTINIPPGVDFENSFIQNNTIVLRVNGSDVSATTRANIKGNFPSSSGSFVFTIASSGNFVTISASNLLFSPERIQIDLVQSSSDEVSLSVTNNSVDSKEYFFSIDFNDGFAFVSSLQEGILSFSSFETKQISVNVSCARNSSGSYFGNLVFDGDFNSTLPLVVNCVSSQNKLAVYPSDKNISITSNSSSTESFLVCNNSSVDYDSVFAFVSGSLADYVSVQSISSISANSCVNAYALVSSPAFGVDNNYSGEITFSANMLSASSLVSMSVLDNGFGYFYLSAQNSDLNHNFDFNGFVFKNSDLNAFSAIGEVDWNIAANYSYSSADFNRDMNGLALYLKFNGKNSGGNYVDYAGFDNNTANISGAFDSFGLFDSNSLFCDGLNDYTRVNDSNTIEIHTGDFSLSAWVKWIKRDSDYSAIVGKGFLNSLNRGYGIYGGSSSTNTGRICFQVRYSDSNFSEICSDSNYMDDSVWVHVVGVVNRNSDLGVSLFINGVSQSYVPSNSSRSTIPFNGVDIWDRSNFTVCNMHTQPTATYNYYFKGFVDEVKVWNRALSSLEVLSDYNSFLGSRFVDSNIFNAGSNVGWKYFKINSDVNFNFGTQISPSENFFDQNLVGLWEFNSKLGSFVYNDVSLEYDGTLINGAEVNGTGLFGTTAGNFDGSNDYVSIRNKSDYNMGKNFSFSAWVLPTAVGSSSGSDVGGKFYSASSPYVSFGIEFMSDYTFAFGTGATDNTYSNTTRTSRVYINRWYHLVATYDGVVKKIYLNGDLSGSTSYTKSIAYNDGNISVGCWYGSLPNNCIRGKIDEVALWSRALSASEVKDLYRKGVSKIDLNIYSCDDALCTEKTSSHYISDANNNSWMSISSLSNSRYLGFDAFFLPANGITDKNAGTFWVGSYLKDVNVSYSS